MPVGFTGLYRRWRSTKVRRGTRKDHQNVKLCKNSCSNSTIQDLDLGMHITPDGQTQNFRLRVQEPKFIYGVNLKSTNGGN